MSGQPKSNERIRYSPLYKFESCFDLSISFGAEKEVLETQTYYIMENDSRNLELKHLGFVRIAVIQTIACVTNLYDYAKQNSGPLRSAVENVESAVNTVVAPAYEKLRIAPDDVLLFLDEKVDKATHEFDKSAPPLAKQAVQITQHFVQKAARTGQELVNEFQTGGPRAAFQYAAKEYKQLILNQGVKIWAGLNRVPSFHKFADKAVPSAEQWLEKYNCTVKEMRQKGYYVFAYLPEVPVSEIAKAFKEGEAKNKEETPPPSPPPTSEQAPPPPPENKVGSESELDSGSN
ncbi:REF/SRPP-like protein At1g67360 [Cucurbita pepo subsp. pepo]|uniref:REF/SRPP-like protein At1g67360 n=1 Tax=Cucurbita pepo subsp. pepo TaxID=3664 RepID=UPI000C9D8619|nr:REF/SRPP-like protein At1g67360 [Cucurbita pepo subsp. pepo]